MRTKLLLFAVIFSLTGILSKQVFAQSGCLIDRDSIVHFDTVNYSTTHHYFHNIAFPNNLEAVVDDTTGNYDSIYYNASNQIIETFSFSGTTFSDYLYTYTGGVISRIDGAGFNGGSWTKSYNVLYTAGEISAILLDTTSVTGMPGGIPGSFLYIHWSASGNPDTINLGLHNILVGGPPNFGYVDTIIGLSTFDTKNNVKSLIFPYGGADGLLSYVSNNNIKLTVFGNDIPAFGANQGDTIEYNIYTYNVDNDVASVNRKPNFFNNSERTEYYFYDCSTVSIEGENNVTMTIYPNPAANYLVVNTGTENDKTATIFSSNGTIIKTISFSGIEHSIDIAGLSNGMYFITINDNGSFSTKKFMKN